LADNCIVKRETIGRRNASSFVPYPEPHTDIEQKAWGAGRGARAAGCRSGGLPQRYHPYPADAGTTQLRIVENRLPCYDCNWRCIYPVAAGSAAYCIEGTTVEQVLDALLDMERGTPGSRQHLPSLLERA